MKKVEDVRPAVVLGVPIFIGLVLLLLLMAAGALTVHLGRMDTTSILQFVLGTTALSGVLTGLMAACRASHNKFLWGVAGGAILFACLLILSLLWVGEPVRWARALLIGGITIFSSAVGAFIGASRRKQKKQR